MFKRRVKQVAVGDLDVFIRSMNLGELASLAMEKGAAKTGDQLAKVVAHWVAKLCADAQGLALFTEEQLLAAEDTGPIEYLFEQCEQHARFTPPKV